MRKKKHLIVLLLFIICTTLVSQPAYFMYETIEAGDVSDKNIYSPKSLTYNDEEATELLIQKSLSEVENSYNENPEIYQEALKKLTTFLQIVKDQKELIRDKQSEEQAKKKTFDESAYLASLHDIKNPFTFDDGQMRKFFLLTNEDLLSIENMNVKMNELFKSMITEENLLKKQDEFKDFSMKLPFSDKKLLTLIVEEFSKEMKPNLVLNELETQKRKKEALEDVKEVMVEIKKNQRIIQKGEVVTEDQIDKLQRLGLLKSEIDYQMILKQAPFFLLIFLFLHLYVMKFYPHKFDRLKPYIFLLGTFLVVRLASDLIHETQFFLAPFLTATILFVVFWGRKFVVFSSIVLALLLYSGDGVLFVLTAVTGVILAIFFDRRGKRMSIITNGVVLGVLLAIAQTTFLYTTETLTIEQVATSFLSLIVSAATAAIVTSGLLIPLAERYLGQVTSASLYELNNPDHELIKRLIREAPGTYHHSLMVGNLAEQAADNIGADGLLLKVGALFHDVGKLVHPEHFIENSRGHANPHDFLDPHDSAQIILQHPLDSAKLCKEYKVPQPIIDLIISHHGDAILYQFYNKAVQNDPHASIEEFQYKTPTPRSKEEGILLLADGVEAYSRVLFEKGVTEEEFSSEIRKHVFSRIGEGQLKHCRLTFEDFEVIVDTFTDYLLTSNHKRISYK